MKKTFEIGDKIKLKTYSPFGDYIKHTGQVGTVIIKDYCAIDSYKIQWDDKSTSRVAITNMKKASDWDEDENF